MQNNAYNLHHFTALTPVIPKKEQGNKKQVDEAPQKEHQISKGNSEMSDPSTEFNGVLYLLQR